MFRKIRVMGSENKVFTVRGREFEIETMPEVKFLLHRPLNGTSGWTVSVCETGQNACWPPRTTSKFAVEATRELFTNERYRAMAFNQIEIAKEQWKKFDAGLSTGF